MCGRFALYDDIETIEYQFQVYDNIHFQPNYNISPSSQVVCLVADDARNIKLSLQQWGVVPKWAKNPSQRIINARSETLFEKPMFKSLIRSKRCCIIANGYYEWQNNPDKTKQPYYIFHRAKKPFAMAGIWDESQDNKQSCIIITQQAHSSLSSIHHRMPLCVLKDNITAWLTAKSISQTTIDNMSHIDNNCLDYYPVTTMVNNPANNTQQCIEPLNNK